MSTQSVTGHRPVDDDGHALNVRRRKKWILRLAIILMTVSMAVQLGIHEEERGDHDSSIDIDRQFTTVAEERAIEVSEATALMDIFGTSRFVDEYTQTGTNDSDEALQLSCEPMMIDREVIEYYTKAIERGEDEQPEHWCTFRYSCRCERVDVIGANMTADGHRLWRTSNGRTEEIDWNLETILVEDRWDPTARPTISGAYVLYQQIIWYVSSEKHAGSTTYIDQILILDSDYRVVAFLGPLTTLGPPS